MKLLKKVFFILIALIALILISALFVDGNYAVERKVTINAPRDQVFEYIKYLENQEQYAVWSSMDPHMKRDYEGVDGEVGFIYRWESEDENVGVGEQEIVSIEDQHRITYELRFKEPFEATNEAYLQTDVKRDSTTEVSWGFKGAMPYPMNLLSLFMNMDDMVGKDLEKGLKNLKEIMEE